MRKNPQKHYKIPKLSFYISYRSIKSINLVAKYNLSLSTCSISVANCIFQNECRLYSQKADILEDFLSPQIKYLFQQKCIYICLLFYWQRSFYIFKVEYLGIDISGACTDSKESASKPLQIFCPVNNIHKIWSSICKLNKLQTNMRVFFIEVWTPQKILS